MFEGGDGGSGMLFLFKFSDSDKIPRKPQFFGNIVRLKDESCDWSYTDEKLFLLSRLDAAWSWKRLTLREKFPIGVLFLVLLLASTCSQATWL